MATPPTRQGFYEVTLKDESVVVAEWKQMAKSEPKQWFRYVSDDPTQEKQPVVLRGVCGWRKADTDTVKQALKREHTHAEHIESALKQFKSHSDICLDRLGAPPANRMLKVGDAVELGHLCDCKVEALSEDGRLVVITHRNISRKHGEVVDNGIAYRAAHWTQLIARANIRSDDMVRSSIMHNGWFNTSLSELFGRVSYGLDDNPTYQRGYAWSAEDKAALLDSLCTGREIGRFILVENNYPRLNEILDGKQRLNCLWEFFTSQIPYQGVYWHELTPRDRNRIETRMVQIVELKSDKYTRADLLQIFLEVNTAGVPQTEAHLQKVRDELAAERTKEAASPKKADATGS
jgi:hypothetical protein